MNAGLLPGATMACGLGHHDDCPGWLLPSGLTVADEPAQPCACGCDHPGRKQLVQLLYERIWRDRGGLPKSKPPEK